MILRPAADEPSDAHKYRLRQVREQLREAGYVEQPDGTWNRPEPPKPDGVTDLDLGGTDD